MSEFKHTPGPWFSPDGKTIKQDYRPIGLSAAAGCMIGAVMGGSTSGPAFIEINDEVAANTKLICAAPDLLEALEEAISMLGSRLIKDTFGYEWHEKATGAIAKARGES